jgi:hypothetical protein
MKTRKVLYFFAMMLATSFFIGSCEKDNDVVTMNEVEDENLTETLFEDVFASVDEAEKYVDDMIFGGTKSLEVVECPVITVNNLEPNTWPKIITIDFGDECTKTYGNQTVTRSGKIVITITGRYRTPGSIHTVTFDNYFINGIKIEGTKTVENMGYNDNQNLWFEVTLTGGKITLPDNRFATREFVRTREWVSGSETATPWDDVYFISGSASGLNFKGVAYTREITTPLEVDLACRFIKSGIVEITVGEKATAVLDYGDGECDALATVTINGVTKEITLKYRHRNF